MGGLWGNLKRHNEISTTTADHCYSTTSPLEFLNNNTLTLSGDEETVKTEGGHVISPRMDWDRDAEDRDSGPPPSCHGGVSCKKSEFLQVVFLWVDERSGFKGLYWWSDLSLQSWFIFMDVLGDYSFKETVFSLVEKLRFQNLMPNKDFIIYLTHFWLEQWVVSDFLINV